MKMIRLNADTHAELVKIGTYDETMDDIIKRCTKAYHELEKKQVDADKEAEIKYNELNHAYQELLEVERLRTSKMDFHSAATLPKTIWIAAINALNLYRVLSKASIHAIEHNDPWKKLLFDVKADGQISTAKLEGEDQE